MSRGLPQFLWMFPGRLLFRATFHNWYGVRRAILRSFGATLSASARVRPTAKITRPRNLTIGRESSIGDGALVESGAAVMLGDFVTVSQHARLCAVLEDPSRGGAVSGPIVVGSDAWISTDAFVGPGVSVGEGAILGARASAMDDLAAWTIYGGDPLRALGPRERPVELRHA